MKSRMRVALLALVSAALALGAGPSGMTTERADIAAGQSLSDVVDLNGHTAVMLYMPSAWTAANLTFQACSNQATASCVNLYDALGAEVTVTAAASRAITLPPADFTGVRYLRIRSGTSAVPVAQAANRSITIGARAF